MWRIRRLLRRFHLTRATLDRIIWLNVFLLAILVTVFAYKTHPFLKRKKKIYLCIRKNALKYLLRSMQCHNFTLVRLNRYSYQLSDEGSIHWDGAIYDAENHYRWPEGRDNPFGELNLRWKLVIYFANVMKAVGEIRMSHIIFMHLSMSKSRYVAFHAFLGMADISHLLHRWKMQMAEYYQRSIWLDVDSLGYAKDTLSRLLAVSTKKNTGRLYKKAIDLHRSTVCFEGLGNLHLLHDDVEIADQMYRCALEISGTCYISGIKARQTRYLLGVEQGVKNTESRELFVINKTAINDACVEDDCKRCITNESITTEYHYNVYINKSRFERNITIAHEEGGYVEISSVEEFGAGKLVFGADNKKKLIWETNHLGRYHAKCFSPGILLETENQLLATNSVSGNIIDDKVFLISGAGWNYYHWLYECMWGILLYKKHFEDIIPLVIGHELKEWQEDFLMLSDVHPMSILQNKNDETHSYTNIVFPIPLSTHMLPHPTVVGELRSVLSRHKSDVKRGKRVYITRKSVRGRKFTNEHEVRKYLINHGFAIIDPAAMTPDEQIDYFSDVEVIVAQGGAALSNLVFCPSQTKVIMFSSERTWAETFTAISGYIGHDVHVLLGEGELKPNPYYIWTIFDYSVCLKTLDQCLSDIL